MKKISVMIPCYNEVENVEPISEAVVDVLERELSNYDYELLFIDNCSTDGTRDKLEKICAKNKKIKAEDWKEQFRYCLVPIIIMSLSCISIKIVEVVYNQLSDCLMFLHQQEGLKNKITAFCLAYGFLLLMCAGASKTGRNLLKVEDERKDKIDL